MSACACVLYLRPPYHVITVLSPTIHFAHPPQADNTRPKLATVKSLIGRTGSRGGITQVSYPPPLLANQDQLFRSFCNLFALCFSPSAITANESTPLLTASVSRFALSLSRIRPVRSSATSRSVVVLLRICCVMFVSVVVGVWGAACVLFVFLSWVLLGPRCDDDHALATIGRCFLLFYDCDTRLKLPILF